MSFAMAAGGLVAAFYVYAKTKEKRFFIGIFYFFLMEFLQGFQYIWIDQCDNPINQVLTFLGFFHIVWQPFFLHYMCSGLEVSQNDKVKYKAILGLCFLGGIWLLSRHLAAPWAFYPPSDACPSTEWLRGNQLCTFSGNYHLSWSVPMYDQTYFSPGASVHFFLMFAPFMVLGRKMIVLGLFTLLTGPILASYITASLFEQASIWCFFSISQGAGLVALWHLQQIGEKKEPTKQPAKGKGGKGQKGK